MSASICRDAESQSLQALISISKHLHAQVRKDEYIAASLINAIEMFAWQVQLS